MGDSGPSVSWDGESRMRKLGVRPVGFLDHQRSSEATESLLSSHSSASLDISVLPVEILAYIFELGSLGISSQESWSWRTPKYPLIIASVCRIWRNVALHVATLIWSSITIFISRSLKIPLLYIERSGGSPLKLFFVGIPSHFPPESNDMSLLPQALHILHKYTHRWEVLTFTCSQHEFPVVMGSLTHARMPKLRTLTIDCMGVSSALLPSIFEADGAPNMSSLTLHHILNLHLQPSLSSITRLELRRCGHSMSYNEMALFLQSFRRLRQLTFVESGPRASKDADRILFSDLLALDFGSGVECLEAFALQTPSLRTLKLSASTACRRVLTLPKLLLSGRYPRPSVETFIISGSLMIPNDIKDILEAFPNVKYLVFHRPGKKQIVKFLLSTFKEGHSWQSLETLTISPWSNERFGKWIDGIGNRDRTGAWRLLERIQLDVADDSQMSVELRDGFNALAKRIEIVPPHRHTDLADISNVAGDLSRGDKR